MKLFILFGLIFATVCITSAHDVPLDNPTLCQESTQGALDVCHAACLAADPHVPPRPTEVTSRCEEKKCICFFPCYEQK